MSVLFRNGIIQNINGLTSGILDLMQRLGLGADNLQKNAVYQIE